MAQDAFDSDLELLHNLFRNDVFTATCIDHELTYLIKDGTSGLEDIGSHIVIFGTPWCQTGPMYN